MFRWERFDTSGLAVWGVGGLRSGAKANAAADAAFPRRKCCRICVLRARNEATTKSLGGALELIELLAPGPETRWLVRCSTSQSRRPIVRGPVGANTGAAAPQTSSRPIEAPDRGAGSSRQPAASGSGAELATATVERDIQGSHRSSCASSALRKRAIARFPSRPLAVESRRYPYTKRSGCVRVTAPQDSLP